MSIIQRASVCTFDCPDTCSPRIGVEDTCTSATTVGIVVAKNPDVGRR